ncbi:MAG: PadR family transcriptional regulator [Mycobacteriales bacterium]|jgi:DNA-binding PadR family transcriptional regulator
MSTTRLFILGVIRFSEPVHGYDIKRELESWHVEEWAHVAYGSIYHALKTLAKDGLIEPVDTGQVGRRPARTTYRITVDGEREYQRLLREYWWTYAFPSDPFTAALAFMPDLPKEELLGALRHRLDALRRIAKESTDAMQAKDMADAPRHVGELFLLMTARAEAEIGWAENLIRKIQADQMP